MSSVTGISQQEEALDLTVAVASVVHSHSAPVLGDLADRAVSPALSRLPLMSATSILRPISPEKVENDTIKREDVPAKIEHSRSLQNDGPVPANSLLTAKEMERSRSQSRDTRKEKLYCICKSADSSDHQRVMIACDQCDNWFHIDCIQLSKTETASIEKYFCSTCRDNDASLKIVYKKKAPKRDEQVFRCGQCIGCFRTENCGKCDGCQKNEDCVKRKCVQADFLRQQKEKKNVSRLAGGGALSAARNKPKTAKNSGDDNATSSTSQCKQEPEKKKKEVKKRRRGRASSEDDDDFMYTRPPKPLTKDAKIDLRNRVQTEAAIAVSKRLAARGGGHKRAPSPVQCLGPGCVLSALPNRKYCSEECGLRLAEERLNKVLPERMKEYWGTVPVAYRRAIEQGRKLDVQIAECTSANEKLLERMFRVQKWVEAIKSIEPVGSDDEDEGENIDAMIACPVCTVDQPAGGLAKHVEKCFVKAEKQITFGTSTRAPQNPGNLFCEVHSKATDTYCKRLRVMCAEHYKGELESEMKICGFPIAWSDAAAETRTFTQAFALFDDVDTMTRAFCQLPRKDCAQHHRWVQATLGVLECDRMNVLTKLDELWERRRAIMATLQTRGDLITLLSNRTTVAADASSKAEAAEEPTPT